MATRSRRPSEAWTVPLHIVVWTAITVGFLMAAVVLRMHGFAQRSRVQGRFTQTVRVHARRSRQLPRRRIAGWSGDCKVCVA